MNTVLKEVFSGKHSRLAMYLAYVGREISDKCVKRYCESYGRKPQSVWNVIRDFEHKGILGGILQSSNRRLTGHIV